MTRSRASIAILCRESLDRVDATREHSFLLARALANLDSPADVWMLSDTGSWRLAGDDSAAGVARLELERLARTYEAVLLQYNPFMYARWGFAPWLPFALRRARRGRPIPLVIAPIVNEAYVPFLSWRWRVMGSWQRLQMSAVLLVSDLAFASMDAWAIELRRRWPHRRVVHVPVGSNLPDRREGRARERARMGVTDDTLVLATFGTGHESRLPEYVAAGANATFERGHEVVVLNLGAGARPLPSVLPGVAVERPGREPAERLADRLAAADLYLAPFIDGVSTRRGSMMAALQHALPVVGTLGGNTDEIFRSPDVGLRLVPVGDIDRFARAAGDLADDARERARLRAEGRRLYEHRFDWPVTAARIQAEIASQIERRSGRQVDRGVEAKLAR